MWWSKNRRRLHLWQETLAQHRMTETEISNFWAWRAQLTARSEAFEVRITDAGGDGERVLVEIEGAEGFSDVKLRRQFLKLWTREIEIGDEAFDDAFLIDGSLGPVYARLDESLRRQLLRATHECDPLEIGDGRLRVGIPEAALPRLLPMLLNLSRQLSEPLDVAGQVAANARRDPRPGVRLANLLFLVREHPGEEETLRALRRACSDVSPQIRVRAAIELGEAGRHVLLKVAERSSDDAAGAQAVAHLSGKLPLERARSILARALNKGFHKTALACLEVLGQRRAAAIGVLTRVMTQEKSELAAAAALALGATGEEAAEPPLLKALQSEDSDLREAAAAALGRVGSVGAVQPLKEATERFWIDLGLRRAARQAIAEIQSRLQGASPGQLSLADADAGQLSLARDDAGQLSLAQAALAQAEPPSE